MNFDVAVCQFSAVRQTAKRFIATHLVSLVDRGMRVRRPSRVPVHHHLIVHCADQDDAGRPDAPTADQVARLLRFGQAVPAGSRVLVHCEAGRRRSTAAALLLLAQALGPGSGRLAAALLVAARPEASPNRLIVALGANVLGQPDLVDIAAQVAERRVQRMLALGKPLH